MQNLVDALDIASKVMRLIETEADPDVCREAITAFNEKVTSSLETYVRACESQAGVTIPNRVERDPVADEGPASNA